MTNEIKQDVTIYTDGACSNNPGLGGWGAILIYKKQDGQIIKKEISKGYRLTTNNRMELSAVIDSLSLLKKPCNVTLYSDSKYVIDAINQKWLDGWQKANWKLNTKNPVKNIDLWQKFLVVQKPHNIKFVWVKGHAQNEYNNQCDKMAVLARNSQNLQTDTEFEKQIQS